MIFVSFGITFCASLFLDKRLYFLKDVHILSNAFKDISGHPKRHLSHFQQVLCRSWLKPHKTAWISVHLLKMSKEVAMAGTFQSNCHTKTRYRGIYLPTCVRDVQDSKLRTLYCYVGQPSSLYQSHVCFCRKTCWYGLRRLPAPGPSVKQGTVEHQEFLLSLNTIQHQNVNFYRYPFFIPT